MSISPRQVSIELLRIIAMLMVLVLHANFLGAGSPSAPGIMYPGEILRTILQASCIVAVNVFVMISGWFGIKASLKGFCNFMWQVIYIVGLLWILQTFIGHEPITMKSLLRIFGLFGGGAWFVASYIGLYILSPVLNAYVKNTSNKNIALMLLAFFAFEFIWGNTLSIGFVIGGYSTFSFIGIYVLAGLLRKYKEENNCILKYFRGGTFILSVLANAIIYIILTKMDIPVLRVMLFNYINPLVIIGAASLLVTFTKLDINDFKRPKINQLILWCAASCFAAYLLHVGSAYALETYVKGVKDIIQSFSDCVAVIFVGLYILAVFIMAILVDQPRKLIWNKLICRLFDKHE